VSCAPAGSCAAGGSYRDQQLLTQGFVVRERTASGPRRSRCPAWGPWTRVGSPRSARCRAPRRAAARPAVLHGPPQPPSLPGVRHLTPGSSTTSSMTWSSSSPAASTATKTENIVLHATASDVGKRVGATRREFESRVLRWLTCDDSFPGCAPARRWYALVLVLTRKACSHTPYSGQTGSTPASKGPCYAWSGTSRTLLNGEAHAAHACACQFTPPRAQLWCEYRRQRQAQAAGRPQPAVAFGNCHPPSAAQIKLSIWALVWLAWTISKPTPNPGPRWPVLGVGATPA